MGLVFSSQCLLPPGSSYQNVTGFLCPSPVLGLGGPWNAIPPLSFLSSQLPKPKRASTRQGSRAFCSHPFIPTSLGWAFHLACLPFTRVTNSPNSPRTQVPGRQDFQCSDWEGPRQMG